MSDNKSNSNNVSIPERELAPILALISHTNSLGLSSWREVVYYAEGEWRCYAGSDTFSDGETVVRWVYADEVLP